VHDHKQAAAVANRHRLALLDCQALLLENIVGHSLFDFTECLLRQCNKPDEDVVLLVLKALQGEGGLQSGRYGKPEPGGNRVNHVHRHGGRQQHREDGAGREQSQALSQE
jgi:hypothetical protein